MLQFEWQHLTAPSDKRRGGARAGPHGANDITRDARLRFPAIIPVRPRSARYSRACDRGPTASWSPRFEASPVRGFRTGARELRRRCFGDFDKMAWECEISFEVGAYRQCFGRDRDLCAR